MKKRFRAVLLSLGLLFLLAQPAFAAELGEPNITPQTTMRELRENPSLKASGYYTYCREMLPIESNYWNNKTLAQYAKPQLVYDCADAMNLVIENYNKGVQVTWQVYTPEEIAENSSLGMVQLFYYPRAAISVAISTRSSWFLKPVSARCRAFCDLFPCMASALIPDLLRVRASLSAPYLVLVKISTDLIAGFFSR